ncbi:hypothetical protein HRI_002462900 [Hibiscus trionum]|uniref:MADS-box domain-containing protein n=1 Tax=Hibiscus trionum TaxID=183268 RepID=A0A9W7M556_HIBTR|nr:hypothetical protein HRI_002462900 [Hibiscus trionum]
MKKKTLGRQKIEMKKMTNESRLQVTFSKRRAGLFKKASELNTLCGVELALVVFSPAKKVFCFGHPSVDTIVDRYLGCDTPDISETSSPIEAHRNAKIRELCAKVNQVRNQIEAEKERGKELDKKKEENQRKYWWKSPIEELDLSQLLQLKSAMEELKKKVDAEKLVVLNANLRQFFVGNSSAEGLNPDNSMAFIASIMGGEYGVLDKIVPTPASTPTPAQGHNATPVNPTEEYNATPAQGNRANPANPQGMDMLGPKENDVLLTLGLGGGGF